MNDRFKFRVWNKEQNRFHHSLNCDISANGTLILSQGIEGKKYIIDDDNYVVQQCTGLKDKNGKLIYEGDIIQFPNPFEKYKVFRQVVNWTLIAYGVGFDITHQKAEIVEVIGNIYENEELWNEN